MKTPVCLSKFVACTPPYPIPPAPNLIKPKPMNRNQKTGGKMDSNNDSMDNSNTKSVLMPGKHAMTTRSSACLEKLQKLKETPTTMDCTPMECETNNILKQTQAPGADNSQVRPPEKPNQTPTLEVKRSQNGTTPPPAKTTTAVVQDQACKEKNSAL